MMKHSILFLSIFLSTICLGQKETELTNNKLKFIADSSRRFAIKLEDQNQLFLNGESIEGLWKIDQLGNMAGQNSDLGVNFRFSMSSPFDGGGYLSSGGATPAAALRLKEPVIGRFGRIHFNNSFEEYWQIQARATNTDIAGIPAEDDLDPELRFYFYDINDGDGRTIMSIDGDDNTVSINSTKDACGHLHVKQKTTDFPAIAMENNGEGNDIWSFEIIKDDLILYYDANGDCENRIAHTIFSPAQQGTDVGPIIPGGLQNPAPMNENLMSKVKQLIPSTFDLGNQNEVIMGFLPDEVDVVFPEIVDTIEDDNEVKSVNYRSFSVIAIKAIQEQQGMIEQLQSQVQQLWDIINSED